MRNLLSHLRRNHPKDRLVPPKAMLYDGSASPEEFVALGDGFLQAILLTRAQLQPTAAVLDVGCGNGAVARPLTTYLQPPGRYEGIDVSAASIAWLQHHYAAYPHFRFTHANVSNQLYNAQGAATPGEYRLPFADQSFDLVLLKSVFTHMLPADLLPYMREIARVLRIGGRSVITYFLLNDEARDCIERGLDAYGLKSEYPGDPLCRIANPAMPEFLVAHDERRIREYYAETGCRVVHVEFGNWSGRISPLGHQDLMIAVKER